MSFKREVIVPLGVSIHAPGRGATSAVAFTSSSVGFQFTHPGGVRLGHVERALGYGRFNSRTREGCDKPYLLDLFAIVGFQFTHPGGVRRSPRLSELSDYSFQFTHPGGVRHH